jgi:hypothetical protein
MPVMPVAMASGAPPSPSAFSRLASLPARFSVRIAPSAQMATPAES